MDPLLYAVLLGGAAMAVVLIGGWISMHRNRRGS